MRTKVGCLALKFPFCSVMLFPRTFVAIIACKEGRRRPPAATAALKKFCFVYYFFGPLLLQKHFANLIIAFLDISFANAGKEREENHTNVLI